MGRGRGGTNGGGRTNNSQGAKAKPNKKKDEMTGVSVRENAFFIFSFFHFSFHFSFHFTRYSFAFDLPSRFLVSMHVFRYAKA